MRKISVLAVLSALIAGCTNQGMSPPITHLLVLTDLSTPEEQAYATSFHDQLARKARRYQTASFDRFSADATVVDYSGIPSRDVVEEIIFHRLQETVPSTDKALLAGAHRISSQANNLPDGERLTAVILTSGTRDPATIEALTEIISTVPTSGSTTIYLAGVNAENVSALTPVFHTIPANAAVVGTLDADLKTLLRRL